MKTSLTKLAVCLSAFAFSASAFAIPTLQVGAPAGAGDSGIYADYSGSSSNPTEADTAVTSGGTILVGGAYGTNHLLIGGQYTGGLSWTDLGFSAFEGHRAVLVASMSPSAGSLTVNGASAFLTSATNLYFPNNHAPLGDATQFMYFDIGDFADTGTVMNFVDETGSAPGEVKSLSIAASGFDWIHFDVMALVTSDRQNPQTSVYSTAAENNPGSHDATWKNPGLPPSEIPEPTTPLLLGLGLIGLFMARRSYGKQC